MRRFTLWVKELWIPLVAVAIFITTSFYQQEIVLRLGVSTVALFRVVVPYVLGIGIWISFAYLVNRLLVIAVWTPLGRRVPVPRLLQDVAAVLIYGLAAMGIVGVVFEKPIGPIWAASGASAIVIGLALRNVILDVFIGLAVHFDRPFEIGETVMLAGGPAGRVVELNWRTTRLITADGNLVVIPNGKLAELIVTNYSRPSPAAEFELPLFLDLEVPAGRALRVLNAAVQSVAGTAGILEDPAPNVRIRAISLQGVEYRIKYFQDPRIAGPDRREENPLKAPSRAQHEIWRSVLEQLHCAGLQPATPKQDIFHAERPRRQLLTHASEDRLALLARVELFAGLTDAERAELSGRMQERLFPEGATILKAGDLGDSMFILCEGLLEVRVALRPGQPETRVATLQAGTFFGEMSALTGEPRSATVRATTEALVFEISKNDISPLVSDRPELAEIIAQAMAARKLRNSEAASQSETSALVRKKESLASQLAVKMLSFFGLKTRARRDLGPVAEIR